MARKLLAAAALLSVLAAAACDPAAPTSIDAVPPRVDEVTSPPNPPLPPADSTKGGLMGSGS